MLRFNPAALAAFAAAFLTISCGSEPQEKRSSLNSNVVRMFPSNGDSTPNEETTSLAGQQETIGSNTDEENLPGICIEFNGQPGDFNPITGTYVEAQDEQTEPEGSGSIVSFPSTEAANVVHFKRR